MKDEQVIAAKPSLLKMITRPTEQFNRINKRPTFAGAIIAIIVLTTIGTWLGLTGFDINTVISPEELNTFTSEEIEAFTIYSKATFIMINLIGVFFKALIMSLLFWFLAKSFESNVNFKQLLSMNLYIFFIISVGLFLNGFITTLVGAGPETMFTSLGALIKVDGMFGELLKNIEVFEIWSLVLTALGLQKVAGYPKNAAWLIAIIFFVITVLLTVANTGTDPIALGF